MRLLHWGLPEPLSALERSPRSGFETRGGLGPVDILWSVTGGGQGSSRGYGQFKLTGTS